MHQGYQTAFFLLGESEDPKVYYYGEGADQKELKVYESIFYFLSYLNILFFLPFGLPVK